MQTPKYMKGLIAALLLAISTFSFAEPININTATADQFVSLKGIGPKKAEAIVRYRTDNGAFASVEELTNVKGIGNATLRKNMERLTISAAQPDQ